MHESAQCHEALAVAVLDHFGVRRILRCAIDAPVVAGSKPESLRPTEVVACDTDTLASRLDDPEQPFDALWLHGHGTWHGIQSLAATLAISIDRARRKSRRLPILVVEGEALEGPPAWSPPESLAAQFRRTESTKEGVRLAFSRLLEGQGYVNLWLPSGVGVGLAVAEEDWQKLGSLAFVVETLAGQLTQVQQRASEALALGYENALAASTPGFAASPDQNCGFVVGHALLASTSKPIQPGSVGGDSSKLARQSDGRVFLLEAGLRRHVPSGLVARILQHLLGPPVQMSPVELDAYEPAEPVHVTRGTGGSCQLIVARERVVLLGFPVISIAPESELEEIAVSSTLNLNQLRYYDPSRASRPRGLNKVSPRWTHRFIDRCFPILKSVVTRARSH